MSFERVGFGQDASFRNLAVGRVNFNADGDAVQILRDDERRAASDKRVEHHVANVAKQFYASVRQLFWKRGGVPDALGAFAVERP